MGKGRRESLALRRIECRWCADRAVFAADADCNDLQQPKRYVGGQIPRRTAAAICRIRMVSTGTAYGNLTAISNTAYSAGCGTGTGCSDKVMQVMWTGARYAVDRNLDVAVA